MNSLKPKASRGSDLPAGLTELLHVDGAAQGDDEHRQVLRGQAVVAHNCIQDLQGNLWERERKNDCTLPCESSRSNPHLAYPGNLLEVKRDEGIFGVFFFLKSIVDSLIKLINALFALE